MGSGGLIMLPVIFIVQNPKSYNLIMGWGVIIFLFLIGNYLVIKSYRKIWAAHVIKRHMKVVSNWIRKSIEDDDPWVINFIITNPKPDIAVEILASCIWSYEKMSKNYTVWSLEKMIENRELFDRIYKKDSIK
jgi:hypothetical protein